MCRVIFNKKKAKAKRKKKRDKKTTTTTTKYMNKNAQHYFNLLNSSIKA